MDREVIRFRASRRMLCCLFQYSFGRPGSGFRWVCCHCASVGLYNPSLGIISGLTGPMSNKTGVAPFYSILARKEPRRGGDLTDISETNDTPHHLPGI